METKELAVVNNEAMQLVKKYQDEKALVFVKEEDLRTQTMFVPEVTVLHAEATDFHNISGRFMPKGYQTDRIGQASGVSFVQEGCGSRKEGDNIFVGYAQGKRRLPDGSWRFSSVCEYEFDVDVRSEEDFAADATKPDRDRKYKTEVSKAAHVLQLKKFARQRANTGARLRVIRELTGMPVSFKGAEIQKAMIFARVAVNTDQLLADPATRQAAVNQALGIQNDLFGPSKENARNVTPNIEVAPEPEEQPELSNEADPFALDEEELSPIERARLSLEDYLNTDILKSTAVKIVKETLANENATLEELEKLMGRCKAYADAVESQGGLA